MGWGESGGMGEGWGDFLATVISTQYGGRKGRLRDGILGQQQGEGNPKLHLLCGRSRFCFIQT